MKTLIFLYVQILHGMAHEHVVLCSGRPTVAAVWWPGTSNLLQYSLVKQAKGAYPPIYLSHPLIIET